MRYTFILLLIFSFLGCKRDSTPSDTKTPAVQRSFFIRYLSDTRQMKAQALSWIGTRDTLRQPVPFAGGITVQGSSMNSTTLPDERIRYEKNIIMDWPGEGFRFSYLDENDKRQEQVISMSVPERMELLSEVSLNRGVRVKLHKGKLSENQQLVFIFSDKNRQSAMAMLDGPLPGEEFTLSGKNLAGLTTGPGQVFAVKKMLEQADHLQSEIEYYLSPMEIEIVE